MPDHFLPPGTRRLKQVIHDLILQGLDALQQAERLPADLPVNVQVTPAKEASQGDFASNIALTLAKPAGMPPRELAALLLEHMPKADSVERIEPLRSSSAASNAVATSP